LGAVSSKTLRDDVGMWFARIKGKEQEYLKIGEEVKKQLMWALRDVSFDIKDGEVLGILGKNGAGKSTLLKILSRVTKPTTGEIKIKGRIASLLEVGTGFHPELTGRENIFLNGSILGMSKAEIKKNLEEIIAFSGVEKYIDTPVKRYSSGMYVRLAFAVAAHLDPEILIVDEVLAVGDFEFQKKCIGKMKDVSTSGRTVVFVSHSMQAVKSLCTRAVMLQAGVVAKEGNVNDVVDFYLKDGAEQIKNGVIPDNASKYNSGDAKFKTIAIINEKGEQINNLYFDQLITVQLELETYRTVDECVIELGFGNSEDRFTFTSTGDMAGKTIKLEKGKHKLSVELNPKLLPGDYSVYLGVHDMSKTGLTLDYVEKIFDITVYKFTADNNSNFLFNASLGKVRQEGKWTITQNK
jgi:lipopolysaccharide transport system ATP-binding protein